MGKKLIGIVIIALIVYVSLFIMRSCNAKTDGAAPLSQVLPTSNLLKSV